MLIPGGISWELRRKKTRLLIVSVGFWWHPRHWKFKWESLPPVVSGWGMWFLNIGPLFIERVYEGTRK